MSADFDICVELSEGGPEHYDLSHLDMPLTSQRALVTVFSAAARRPFATCQLMHGPHRRAETDVAWDNLHVLCPRMRSVPGYHACLFVLVSVVIDYHLIPIS